MTQDKTLTFAEKLFKIKKICEQINIPWNLSYWLAQEDEVVLSTAKNEALSIEQIKDLRLFENQTSVNTPPKEEIKNYRQDFIFDLLKTIEPETYEREGLQDTPSRVDKMYNEIYGGYALDPIDILGTVFEDEFHKEMVIVKDIQFYSHCEHHMVPFFGKAHIGYIPDGRIVGLSKLARLVDCFARRLQIQERMTTQIADTITQVLNPLGVMVVIEAEHLCMKMRGIKNPCADTITSAVRGVLKTNEMARAEFISLIGKGR